MVAPAFKNYLNPGALQQHANSYRFIQFWKVIVILLARRQVCEDRRGCPVHAERDGGWSRLVGRFTLLVIRQVEGIARIIFARAFSKCVAIIQPGGGDCQNPLEGEDFPYMARNEFT